jgi:hypothetical protein
MFDKRVGTYWDCPPPVQPAQGAPYNYSKNIPPIMNSTGQTQNHLYLTAVDATVNLSNGSCIQNLNGAQVDDWCLAQACKCVPSPRNPCGTQSPLVIDTTGEGFPMTDWEDGVSFDILGTGTPVKMGRRPERCHL